MIRLGICIVSICYYSDTSIAAGCAVKVFKGKVHYFEKYSYLLFHTYASAQENKFLFMAPYIIAHLINAPSIYIDIQILSHLFDRYSDLFTLTLFPFFHFLLPHFLCNLLNVTMLPSGHVSYIRSV